jgi:hypothetical protein
MPQLVLIPELMKIRFRAFNITLPSQDPSVVRLKGGGPSSFGIQSPGTRPVVAGSTSLAGSSKGYSAASISSSSRPATGLPLPMPPALFRPSSNQAPDCDYQRTMNDDLGKVFDVVCESLKYIFDQWRSLAFFTGVVINSVTATGGRLAGPSLDTFAAAAPGLQGLSGWGKGLCDGVVGGFSAAWKDYCLSVSVPGLPWYPQFAALPMPMAPPTPNIPTPFQALAGNLNLLSSNQLSNAMTAKGSMNTPYQKELFTAVAEVLATALTMWRGAQQVTHVMGTGPIPSFAPPFVPVGPVVGGTVLPQPGCLQG